MQPPISIYLECIPRHKTTAIPAMLDSFTSNAMIKVVECAPEDENIDAYRGGGVVFPERVRD